MDLLTLTDRQLDQHTPYDNGDQALARFYAELDRQDNAQQARLTAPGALAAAALWYAHCGLAVFPVRPREKRPLTRHGLHDATTDTEQIRAWWQATPTANIGLPTGRQFDVIDVDGPTGYASLHQLAQSGALPALLGRVQTPRGVHLWIEHQVQADGTDAGNGTGLFPGIDYRGKSGYVLAPPSVGPTGRRYAWTPGQQPALLAPSQVAA